MGDDTLHTEIARATKLAYLELSATHPAHYYYFVLVTTGEAHTPVIAAWSEEALEEAVASEADKDDAKWGIKWSYADSPFLCFGEQYFKRVNGLFGNRPDIRLLSSETSQAEYDLRLEAMERALHDLDEEGLFGRGDERNAIMINVEVVPPDSSNTIRAVRLNPPEAVKEWIAEMAE